MGGPTVFGTTSVSTMYMYMYIVHIHVHCICTKSSRVYMYMYIHSIRDVDNSLEPGKTPGCKLDLLG